MTRDYVDISVKPLIVLNCGSSLQDQAARSLGNTLGQAVQDGQLSQANVDLAAWVAARGAEVPTDQHQEAWASTVDAMLYAIMHKARAMQQGRATVWKQGDRDTQQVELYYAVLPP